MKFLILGIYCICSISAQNASNSVSYNVSADTGNQVNQVIPSGTPQAINSIISTLFPNQQIDDTTRNAITQYATLTDQANIPIQNLINAKKQLLNSIPETLKVS